MPSGGTIRRPRCCCEASYVLPRSGWRNPLFRERSSAGVLNWIVHKTAREYKQESSEFVFHLPHQFGLHYAAMRGQAVGTLAKLGGNVVALGSVLMGKSLIA